MIRKSNKVTEAEKLVDDYIKKNGNPPTYAFIAKELKISRTAAYARCQKFLHKMKNNGDVEFRKSYTKVKLELLVPNSKFREFAGLLSEIQSLLKTQ